MNEDGTDKSCQHAIMSYKFNVNGLWVHETAVNEDRMVIQNNEDTLEHIPP